MTTTPDAVVVDLVLAVQCGQSVVVPIAGKNVLITASSADATPTPPPTPTTPSSSVTTVPVKLPEILPPVILPPSSVATFIEELEGSVPVLQLHDFIRLSEPSEPQINSEVEGLTDQMFEIEGVAGLVLPGRAVAADDLAELGVADSIE